MINYRIPSLCMQIARFNQEILIGLSKLAGISAKVSELETQIVYKRYATEKKEEAITDEILRDCTKSKRDKNNGRPSKQENRNDTRSLNYKLTIYHFERTQQTISVPCNDLWCARPPEFRAVSGNCILIRRL